MLCIRYESLTLMIMQILALLNGLVDKVPKFWRNIFPPFSVMNRQSAGSSKNVSTYLQNYRHCNLNTQYSENHNLIWSVLYCSLLSIQISEMCLNRHMTHPNAMWPPCSCRIIWCYPTATTDNTCCCYSPDFTLDWPSWHVTESNCVVLGQIAAATATAIGFICVTHTDNRLVLMHLMVISYCIYLFNRNRFISCTCLLLNGYQGLFPQR
jgi:hypothetical protein